MRDERGELKDERGKRREERGKRKYYRASAAILNFELKLTLL
jgi:hypothetical protein